MHWRIEEKYLSVRHVRIRQPAPVPQQALACELRIAMGVGPTKVRSLKLQAFLLHVSSDVLLATATTFLRPVVTWNGQGWGVVPRRSQNLELSILAAKYFHRRRLGRVCSPNT